jgi:hypothetical protein
MDIRAIKRTDIVRLPDKIEHENGPVMTLLSRVGVSRDIAERCLGHVIGGVRGVYDR